MAAILHLASIIPANLLFRTANYMSYNGISIGQFIETNAKEFVCQEKGIQMSVPLSSPGLGIKLNPSLTRNPVFAIGSLQKD